MQNSKISFTSKISLATKYSFDQAAKNTKNVVGFPWTAREILKADKAYSRGICCCTAGGVITNDKKITMFHIEPSSPNLKDWHNIIRVINEKVGQSNQKVQGFLLGSFNEESCRKIFDNFKDFMNRNNIPYSKFGLQKSPFANTDILYNAKSDEWLVTSDKISEKIKAQNAQLISMPKKEQKKQLLKIVHEEFEEVELLPFDELSFIPADSINF